MPWCDSFEDGFALAAERSSEFSLLLASKESTVGGELLGYPWLSALLREIHWGANAG
jgi:hypothetical protein